MIQKHRKKIMRREFSEVCQDESKWPIIKDNEQFRFYFSAFLGLIVVDLLESDLVLKSDIQSQLKENIKKVDYNLFRKDIVNLYEKFVNNNKKVYFSMHSL